MTATLVRKFWMAGSGLFLCLFLVVHLGGNLQLILPEADARESFNRYAETLSRSPLIALSAWITYAALVIHVVLGIMIDRRNRAAAGSRGVGHPAARVESWPARSMTWLGLIILIFLVVHMADFWWPFRFGALPADDAGQRDLFGLVVQEFRKGWKVALYLIGVVALGLHLAHGVHSAARTMGLSCSSHARRVRRGGIAFALIVTLGFGALPIFLHLCR